MKTKTQLTIRDIYQSVLKKFNLKGWEGGDSNILYLSEANLAHNLIGEINSKTWEVTPYDKDILTPEIIAELKKELSTTFINLVKSL